jgi:hypothetical protein
MCENLHLSGEDETKFIIWIASKNKSIIGEIYCLYFKLKMFLSTTFKMDVPLGLGSSLSVEIMEGMPLAFLIN